MKKQIDLKLKPAQKKHSHLDLVNFKKVELDPKNLENRRKLNLTIGVLLIVFGAILGLVPVLQGWLFGLPGLLLIHKNMRHHNRLKKYTHRLISKVPKKYRSSLTLD